MADLAVIILTFNEERHIGRALASVAPIAKQVFVVDSGSTDRTAQIAAACGATVLEHEFVNYAKQFQWALDHAPVTAAWVMRLDADEVVEPDLAREIDERLPNLSGDTTGVNLKRKQIFMGRWIRHGGRYPLVMLRIWRRGMGRIEDRWMDEHSTVAEGRTVTMDGGFADHNLNDLGFFIAKHNAYATREAIDVLHQRRGLTARRVPLNLRCVSQETATKRFIKETIYNRLPFPIGAAGYFFYRYVLQLGFLDGKEGLIYHGLQGFWYRFLVGAKVYELEKAISHIRGAEEAKAELSRLTGLRIE